MRRKNKTDVTVGQRVMLKEDYEGYRGGTWGTVFEVNRPQRCGQLLMVDFDGDTHPLIGVFVDRLHIGGHSVDAVNEWNSKRGFPLLPDPTNPQKENEMKSITDETFDYLTVNGHPQRLEMLKDLSMEGFFRLNNPEAKRFLEGYLSNNSRRFCDDGINRFRQAILPPLTRTFTVVATQIDPIDGSLVRANTMAANIKSIINGAIGEYNTVKLEIISAEPQ